MYQEICLFSIFGTNRFFLIYGKSFFFVFLMLMELRTYFQVLKQTRVRITKTYVYAAIAEVVFLKDEIFNELTWFCFAFLGSETSTSIYI